MNNMPIDYKIKVDGDTITINPKFMFPMKIYWFQYHGERYGAFKDDEGIITILEEV